MRLSRPLPEQSYRSSSACSLEERNGAAQVNDNRHVDAILEHGLDHQGVQLALPASRSPRVRAHLRGRQRCPSRQELRIHQHHDGVGHTVDYRDLAARQWSAGLVAA